MVVRQTRGTIGAIFGLSLFTAAGCSGDGEERRLPGWLSDRLGLTDGTGNADPLPVPVIVVNPSFTATAGTPVDDLALSLEQGGSPISGASYSCLAHIRPGETRERFGCPPGMTFSATTGAGSWTPSETQAGSWTIRVSARTPAPVRNYSADFSVTVAVPNRAPTAGSLTCSASSVTASLSGTIPPASCQVAGWSDPDGDAPVVETSHSCGGSIAYEGTSGVWSGSLGSSVTSGCQLTLTLHDGAGHVRAGKSISVGRPSVTMALSQSSLRGEAGGPALSTSLTARINGQPVTSDLVFSCEVVSGPSPSCPGSLAGGAFSMSPAATDVGQWQLRFPGLATSGISYESPTLALRIDPTGGPAGGPTISALSSATPNGTYSVGRTIDIVVSFSDFVLIQGPASGVALRLETGSDDALATLISPSSAGSTTRTLTFRYLVRPGDWSSDLEVHVAGPQIVLASTSRIIDRQGRNAVTALPAGVSLASVKAIVVSTGPLASCTLGADTVPHGATISRQRYSTDLVAAGSTCLTETRSALCENGTLTAFSGTFQFESCSEEDVPDVTASLVGPAQDFYINSAELLDAEASIAAATTDRGNISYSLASSTTACSSVSAAEFSPVAPRAGDLSLLPDGNYLVCVRAVTMLGSESRTATPTFSRLASSSVAVTAFVRIGVAVDNWIGIADQNDANPIVAAAATGQVAISYGMRLFSGTCNDSGISYSANAPRALDFDSDGTRLFCARATDVAGNHAYSNTLSISRDTAPPSVLTWNALPPINAAGAGIYTISGACSSQNERITIAASLNGGPEGSQTLTGQTSAQTPGCSAALIWSTTVAIDAMGGDGTVVFSFRSVDSAGNQYGGGVPAVSSPVTKDLTAPSFISATTLATGVAADSYINDAEKASTTPLIAFAGAGYDTASFSIVASNAICDASQAYPLSAAARAVDLISDGAFKICIRLSDTVGNPSVYGASPVVTRDTVISLPSVALAGPAADALLNSADTVNPNPIAQASGIDPDATATFKLQSGASSCPVSLALGDGAATITGVSTQGQTDGIYRVCVIAQDAAGNKAVASSPTFTLDVTPPGAFSITPATNISTTAGSKAINWTTSSGTNGYQIYASSDKACQTTFHTGSAGLAATSTSISFPAGNSYVCISSSDAAGNLRWGSNAEPTANPYAVQVQQDNVVGQPNATTVTNKAKAIGSGTSSLSGEVFGSKLYVADGPNNRVLIYAWPVMQDDPTPIEVLGQPDFNTSFPNHTGSTTGGLPCAKCLSGPLQTAVQSSGSVPTHLWVADRNNLRIVRYPLNASGLPTGGRHAAADLVLGASSLTVTGTSNCDATSVSGRGVAIAGGRLYAADIGNTRVLVYSSIPTTSNAAAANVIGQTTLTNCSSFTGTVNSTTFQPYNIAADGTYLYVGMSPWHRVLVFNVSGTVTNLMPASYVLGQSNFSGNSPGSGSFLNFPLGIWSSPATPYVFVGDKNNKRVVAYDKAAFAAGLNAPAFQLGDGTAVKAAPTAAMISDAAGIWGDANGMVVIDGFFGRGTYYDSLPDQATDLPIRSIGLPSLTTPASGPITSNSFAWAPSELSFEPGPAGACVMNNMLFVADVANNRVLVWNPVPASLLESASYVLGQPGFTTNTAGNSASGLSDPSALYCDETRQKLYVGEPTNGRLKVFDTTSGITTNMPASFVLGQTSFSGSTPVTPRSAVSLSGPRAIWGDATRLWVADSSSHRVLGYTLPISSNGQAASVVLGQQNFTDNAQVTTVDGLRFPLGGWSDGSTLYVADRNSHRIMVWTNLGSIVTTGGADATMVLGQTNFTSSTAPSTPSQSNLNQPTSVFVDAGKIYVVDGMQNRVMIWNSLPAAPGANPASSQFGHANFTTASEPTITGSSLNDPAHIFRSGNYWYIVDRGNRRIIQKTTMP